MKYIKILVQLLALSGISMLGNTISSMLNIGIPGNIIGMVILFGLLERKLIALDWIETGANFLISELLLFFIPSAIGIIQFPDLLKKDSVNLLLVIVSSTAAVVIFVGLVTELVSRHRERSEKTC
jgi:holin-like protein